MPLSTKKQLIDAFDGDEFRVNMGRTAGFVCPVCCEWLSTEGEEPGECDHLLRYDFEGSEWNRKCWVRVDGPIDDDGDVDEDEEATWVFEPRKARKKKDRTLLDEEWVSVHTSQCDVGGIAWHGWFAVPVKLLSGTSPRSKMEKLIAKTEAALINAGAEEA